MLGESRAANALEYVRVIAGVPQTDTITRSHGLSLFVPEINRTFYFHFGSDQERQEWLTAISTNVELHRQAPGKIQEMIGRVATMTEAGRITCDKLPMVKTTLRSRYKPVHDSAPSDRMSLALQAISLFDHHALRALQLTQCVNDMTPAGSTLLAKACTVGNVEAAVLLLDCGADPNLCGTDGDSPLIIAGLLWPLSS